MPEASARNSMEPSADRCRPDRPVRRDSVASTPRAGQPLGVQAARAGHRTRSSTGPCRASPACRKHVPASAVRPSCAANRPATRCAAAAADWHAAPRTPAARRVRAGNSAVTAPSSRADSAPSIVARGSHGDRWRRSVLPLAGSPRAVGVPASSATWPAPAALRRPARPAAVQLGGGRPAASRASGAAATRSAHQRAPSRTRPEGEAGTGEQLGGPVQLLHALASRPLWASTSPRLCATKA